MDDTLHHKQLRNVVAERIRTAILDGRYKPGGWLRQQRIAEELGVSPMPVREALKQLAAEGVVEHVPYRGARVIEFSPEDVADLYAQRSFLESRAARAAARHITRDELNELYKLQTQMEAPLASGGLSEYTDLNRRFHQVVYTASRRDYLVRALDQIWSAFPTMMMSYFAQRGSLSIAERATQDLEEHAVITMALESGDGDRAGQLMAEHIDANCRELLSALDCGS